MKGLLVVNGFLKSSKFDDLYFLLNASAVAEGIELTQKTSIELMKCVGNSFKFDDRPDFVIFWDKDIYCAELLEKENIPVINSSSAIAICDNKARTTLSLAKNKNISTPKTVIAPKTFENIGYTDLSFLQGAAQILGFPMVIKECYGSFGKQVYLAHTLSEAEDIVSKIGGREFIMQEFISSSNGRDIRINIVGGKVISSMLRYSTNGDFRSNITIGGNMETYSPSDEEKDMALSACRAVGCEFAGIDVLFGKDGPIICEVNSSPHFRSTLECTGTDLSKHIIKYIKNKIQKENI